MEGRDEQLLKAVSHYLAASRLRSAMAQHPDAKGLGRLYRVHVASAGTLAASFCGSR